MVSNAVDARHCVRKPLAGSKWLNLCLIPEKFFLLGPHLTESVSNVAEILKVSLTLWSRFQRLLSGTWLTENLESGGGLREAR